MIRKAAYFLFSSLIVLSGTFAVAPMAFCLVIPAAPLHSCCNPPETPHNQCPICVFDLNKIEPSPANTSVKTQDVSKVEVSRLSYTPSIINSSDLGIPAYSGVSCLNSSPPLYLQNRTLRI